MKKNLKLEELLKLPKEILKGHTKMFRMEGVFLIFLGIIAIALPLLCAVAIELLLGTLFILAGIAGLLRSFKSKDIPGTIFSILTYFLFLVAGIMVITKPLLGIKTLAIILGCFFLVSGFFKIIFAYNLKPAKGWGWTLFDGSVSIILGAIIFQNWPFSAVWIVGVIVGIRLIILGNAMIMIANGLKQSTD